MPDRNEDTRISVLYFGVEPLTRVPLYRNNEAAQEDAIVHPKRMMDPLVLFICMILILVAAVTLLLSIVWSV